MHPWKQIVAPIAAAFLPWPIFADELAVVDSPEKAVAVQQAAAVKLGKPAEWSNSIGMKFRLVPAGEFVMGSAGGEADATTHRVRLTQPFYMGCFEVTREQWETVTGKKHSDFFPGPDMPMNLITWYDATSFIKALSKQEAVEYRLPTEAEWEFAARAGSATAYPTGDTEQELAKAGWYAGNDGGTLHPVGQKVANAFGLHDMNGNAWEWCEDFYDANYYAVSPVENPAGPALSTYRYRVLRGGAAFFDANYCRSTTRNYYQDSRTTKLIGFRIMLPVATKAPTKPNPPQPKK
jgi:formylglycine-generating enzyme required for sulfatase activity